METITFFYSKKQHNQSGRSSRIKVGEQVITYTEMMITRSRILGAVRPLPHISNWEDAITVYQFTGTLEQCMDFTFV